MTLFDDGPPGLERTAVISDDGLYRYRLGRCWGGGPTMAFIMLNPSIADASIDDPTIVRCMGYARREGCDGIDVVNLFAYRSPAPTDLLEAEDPVGPDNDHHLREVIAGARFVVAGWGVWPAKPALARYDRPNHVVRIARDYDRQVSCLRRTKDGHPGHPLYLPGEAPLLVWAPT